MFTNRGHIQMKTWMILPFILFVSQSLIKNPGRNSGGVVYAIHITPWFAIGIDWISKQVEFDDDFYEKMDRKNQRDSNKTSS